MGSRGGACLQGDHVRLLAGPRFSYVRRLWAPLSMSASYGPSPQAHLITCRFLRCPDQFEPVSNLEVVEAKQPRTEFDCTEGTTVNPYWWTGPSLSNRARPAGERIRSLPPRCVGYWGLAQYVHLKMICRYNWGLAHSGSMRETARRTHGRVKRPHRNPTVPTFCPCWTKCSALRPIIWPVTTASTNKCGTLLPCANVSWNVSLCASSLSTSGFQGAATATTVA